MKTGMSPVGTTDPSFNRPYGTRIYVSRLFPGTYVPGYYHSVPDGTAELRCFRQPTPGASLGEAS